jgi:hypothetical protein
MFARLALRATQPIADKREALRIHEELSNSLMMLAFAEMMLERDRDIYMRSAHKALDAIERALQV